MPRWMCSAPNRCRRNTLIGRTPNVTVTPHIASETRPVTAAQVICENIRRGEAGEPFLHLVDRQLGY